MNAVTDTRDLYRRDFEAARATLPGAQSAWLARRRDEALAFFLDAGYPGVRHEDWKYTDVRPLAQRRWQRAEAVQRPDFTRLAGYAAGRPALVFVDGLYQPALSTPPDGVRVESLAELLRHDPEVVEPWLATGAPRDGFAALNLAFLNDGAFIELDAGAAPEAPLELLFIASGTTDSVGYARNLVVAGPGSRATLVERYVALDDASYFTNAISEVYVEEGAALEHYRLEHEARSAYHVGATHARIGRRSHYTGHGIVLGGRLARTGVYASLDADGGECRLNGLYLGRDRQHLDVHTRIDHRSPGCTSRDDYKGVLDGQARGVFTGRTVVHPGAQKTDAGQSNHNLLLSPVAEADSRPQLEIYADDVKCAHGSSTGSLDPDALFYLRSRALDEAAARGLLTYAFVADVLARMRLAGLRRVLGRELAGALLAAPMSEELLP